MSPASDYYSRNKKSMRKTVAIIPARGGSKRIPRKNIKDFLGHPILGHVITLLKETRIFDQVIVSTDDSEIKTIANEYGADEIVDRPLSLADDLTPTQPVIQHAIKAMKVADAIICCIYPCTPLLTKKTILSCVEQVRRRPEKFSFPVLEYKHPIQRSFTLEHANQLVLTDPEHELSRTQDLTTHFHDSGSIYCALGNVWLSEKRIHSTATGVVVDYLEAIDIDTEADWQLAEYIYRSRSTHNA